MIYNKMTPAFQKYEGGLFGEVEKADVGDAVEKSAALGIANMAWADPFYPAPSVPSHVSGAMIETINSGFASHYTVPIGNFQLKQEIAKKLLKTNGINADPNRNIIVTPGSDSGLYFAMLPFIKGGDEVMIIDPSYPNNFQNTEIMGGVCVRVPVYEKDAYQFNIEEFEKRVTSKTKMIVLSNPNNPTTTVYRKEKLEQLAQFAIKHDLVVVVDQAFEDFCFDDIEMVTIASLKGMWERTVTVCSLSKGMGLSGLRVGYIVADDRIIDKMIGATVTVLGATNTVAQHGAIAALKDPSFMKAYYDTFDERRKLTYKYLHDIPGVSMRLSESGFLSWVNVEKLGTNSEVMAYLNKNAKVTINSGNPYGQQGKGYIRIVHGVFATSNELESALIRMRGALIELAQEKGITS